ncbi:MAG: hypothetical protein GX640_11360, partial [Fibrobacter sp.]|nr:hypothetical protein [Fibrobacter sp.]
FNESDPQSLEKYSSAITLSDMEVFIFPELMYALTLANIMSPRIWEWKKDPWFSKLDKMSPYRRLQRMKQFIMDHFTFNLDLDTWGLTTKPKELARFSSYINEDVLAQSNALFGYEGDKYYFNIDIRKHFGLDKYTSDIIPYWKTETVEAMEAFKYKPGYPCGAGECVSLAALYAASAFILAETPLDNIFMLATPLHSQNFLDIGDGVITNNRRLVTKTMWFNGTELTAKARRALDNERVTIVAHKTGYIHTLYNKSTISEAVYTRFKNRLSSYLKTNISFEILANFLRDRSHLQKCFQIEHNCCGKPRYIEAEKVYTYEHSSKFRVGDSTQNALLHEIEEDEFYTSPLPNRMILGEIENFFKNSHINIDDPLMIENLKKYLCNDCMNIDSVMVDLKKFCHTEPQLPDEREKINEVTSEIDLDGVSSADEAISKIEALRDKNVSADLAFSAFRDLSRSPWKPFLKAALERNPVSILAAESLSPDQIYNMLLSMEDLSIYNESYRLAQPDEVWNYSRGDGLEKALCMANILKNRFPDDTPELQKEGSDVILKFKSEKYAFKSLKNVGLPLEKDFLF